MYLSIFHRFLPKVNQLQHKCLLFMEHKNHADINIWTVHSQSVDSTHQWTSLMLNGYLPFFLSSSSCEAMIYSASDSSKHAQWQSLPMKQLLGEMEFEYQSFCSFNQILSSYWLHPNPNYHWLLTKLTAVTFFLIQYRNKTDEEDTWNDD